MKLAREWFRSRSAAALRSQAPCATPRRSAAQATDHSCLAPATALLVFLLTGCTHATVHRVARYRPVADSAPAMTVAPATGVYGVRYAPPGGEMRNLDDSERIVRKGEPLGFDVADDGSLLAVAGGEQFLLPLRRDAIRKC